MARTPRRPSPPTRPGSPAFSDVAVGLGLVVLLAVFLMIALPLWTYTVDDAWITFRYSANWAAGLGPYFNAGEHVEGYSNFLLMGALAVLVRLGGPDVTLPVAKLLGLAAAAGMMAGAWAVARALASAAGERASGVWAAGLVAAGLVLCAPGFAVNAAAGLETSLYGCLVVWGTYGFATGHARAGAVTLGLAALTRPEGPLLFALAWALHGLAGLRPAGAATGSGGAPSKPWDLGAWLVAAAIGAGLIGAHLLFRHAAYDGEWLPNTFHAKLGGSGDRVAYVLGGAVAPFLGIAGSLVALLGWALEPRTARVALVVAGVGIVGGALPLYTGGDWMLGHRLIVPYLPLLAALVCVGWLRLASHVPRSTQSLAIAALLLTLPAAWWSQRTERREVTSAALLTAMGTRTGHGELATWLAGEARPGEAVVLMDIGLIGFRLREQRIVDVTGLTDRTIARSPGEFMAKRFDLDYIFGQRPRWIVLSFLASGEPYAPIAPAQAIHPFSGMEERLAAHADFARHYVEPPRAPGANTDELENLATRLRARRVFRAAAPGRHYLLAVYSRHD